MKKHMPIKEKVLNLIHKVNFLKIIIDLLLVILFPILLYLSHFHWHFLIWITFVPIVILAYRNKYPSFLLCLLPISLGYISIAYFIRYFSWNVFLISMFFIVAALIISFSLCWFFYKKIKYPFSLPVFTISLDNSDKRL